MFVLLHLEHSQHKCSRCRSDPFCGTFSKQYSLENAVLYMGGVRLLKAIKHLHLHHFFLTLNAQVETSKLTTCPPRGVPGMLYFDIVLKAVRKECRLLLPGPADHRSVPPFPFEASARCPPQLAISLSLHISGAELIRSEKSCPTAIHAWLVLAMFARGEQKHSRIGFCLQDPLRWREADLQRRWSCSPWSSSVFCVTDRQEWLSVSKGDYMVIKKFRLMY